MRSWIWTRPPPGDELGCRVPPSWGEVQWLGIARFLPPGGRGVASSQLQAGAGLLVGAACFAWRDPKILLGVAARHTSAIKEDPLATENREAVPKLLHPRSCTPKRGHHGPSLAFHLYCAGGGYGMHPSSSGWGLRFSLTESRETWGVTKSVCSPAPVNLTEKAFEVQRKGIAAALPKASRGPRWVSLCSFLCLVLFDLQGPGAVAF